MQSQHDISNLINSRAPSTVLIIGPSVDELAQTFSSLHPETRISLISESDPAARLAGIDRQDLALVVNTLEYLDKATGGLLISRLRDLYTKCLVVVVGLGEGWPNAKSVWTEADLLAFGLTEISRVTNEAGLFGMFEFNIKDYKLSPDWLNCKSWANPELWDKYRW